MFKINNLVSYVCLLSAGLSLTCQANHLSLSTLASRDSLHKKKGVTQVDLDQPVMKGRELRRKDVELAREVINESAHCTDRGLKKEAKQLFGRVSAGFKGKVQLDKRTIVTQHEVNCTQCKGSLMSSQVSTPEKSHSSQELIIFVSESVPAASLKALFFQAQSLGVPLVFRGLIGNSFVKTKSFFEAQQMNGEVDPTLFETYKVSEVPTFVLRKEKSFDTVQGNISLQEALTLFKNKGDLKQQAGKLLASMKASHL